MCPQCCLDRFPNRSLNPGGFYAAMSEVNVWTGRHTSAATLAVDSYNSSITESAETGFGTMYLNSSINISGGSIRPSMRILEWEAAMPLGLVGEMQFVPGRIGNLGTDFPDGYYQTTEVSGTATIEGYRFTGNSFPPTGVVKITTRYDVTATIAGFAYPVQWRQSPGGLIVREAFHAEMGGITFFNASGDPPSRNPTSVPFDTNLPRSQSTSTAVLPFVRGQLLPISDGFGRYDYGLYGHIKVPID